jgi:hypothetical protein
MAFQVPLTQAVQARESTRHPDRMAVQIDNTCELRRDVRADTDASWPVVEIITRNNADFLYVIHCIQTQFTE